MDANGAPVMSTFVVATCGLVDYDLLRQIALRPNALGTALRPDLRQAMRTWVCGVPVSLCMILCCVCCVFSVCSTSSASTRCLNPRGKE